MVREGRDRLREVGEGKIQIRKAGERETSGQRGREI